MEYAESREEAESFARNALDLMAQHGVPATPRNYTIWYTYVSGANPDLKAEIDTLTLRSDAFDSARNAYLYQRFFGFSDVGDAVEVAGNDIQKSIHAVMDMLHTATDGAQTYGRTLERSVGSLDETVSLQELQQVVGAIVVETGEMVARNVRLESELKNSSGEIETLRQRLDDVRRESMTDSLTGIANRKHFDLILRKEAGAVAGSAAPLCLILADIDHFKRFNDTFGHQTGDVVLKLVARSLTQNIKGRDTAARYGGEEFAIVLPATELEDAASLAEQIRQAVASKRLRKKQTGEELGSITLSFGVAKYRPGEPLADLIRRADEELYRAKGEGRNRVASESPRTDPAMD